MGLGNPLLLHFSHVSCSAGLFLAIIIYFLLEWDYKTNEVAVGLAIMNCAV